MIYICIPALDEARTIGVLLWKVRQVMESFARDYQVLVLDDGSTDDTREVLEPYRRVLPVDVLRNERTQGYAKALERLIREAVHRATHPKRDVVVVMQADFTENPADIPRLIAEIEGGSDVVGAEVTETEGELPRALRWGRRGLPWLVRSKGLPKEIKDPLAGFRAYRVSVLKRALIDRDGKPLLTKEGWAANAELLLCVSPHVRRAAAAEVSLRYTRRERPTRFRPWSTAMELWGLARSAPRRLAEARASAAAATEAPARDARPPRPAPAEASATATAPALQRESRRERGQQRERRPEPREHRPDAQQEPRPQRERRPDAQREARSEPQREPRQEPQRERRPRPAPAAEQPGEQPSSEAPAQPKEGRPSRRQRERMRRERRAAAAAAQDVGAIDVTSEQPATESAEITQPLIESAASDESRAGFAPYQPSAEFVPDQPSPEPAAQDHARVAVAGPDRAPGAGETEDSVTAAAPVDAAPFDSASDDQPSAAVAVEDQPRLDAAADDGETADAGDAPKRKRPRRRRSSRSRATADAGQEGDAGADESSSDVTADAGDASGAEASDGAAPARKRPRRPRRPRPPRAEGGGETQEQVESPAPAHDAPPGEGYAGES